jgi:hypothetical protein
VLFRIRYFSSALFCVLALGLCVAIAHPVSEMGYTDDWSYIWSARVLADTGHFVYNGWATAMLGWQLYLGALFIKLFGFSFTVVRMSTLLVAMSTAVLMQMLFVRFGIREWNATIATLTICLSPVFLPLAFSFMSDVPGLFCLLLCVYGCVRALQAETDQTAIGWLIVAAVSNVFGGTVRQIVWLGALALVPSTAWAMRDRRKVLNAAGILWILSAIAIAGFIHWFKIQPYSISEKLLPSGLNADMLGEIRSGTFRSFLAFGMYVLPVSIAFLVRYPMAILSGSAILLATLVLVLRQKPVLWLVPFSGVFSLPGKPPEVFSRSTWAGLAILNIAAIIASLLCGFSARSFKDRGDQPGPSISWSGLATMFGPFTLAYIVLISTRVAIYDRYLLPLLFVTLVFALRFYQQKWGNRLPAASFVLVVLFAAFGVADMHDVFAMDRARVLAADRIIAAGNARTDIEGGFEYDGWTELEAAGYVNDLRIRVPVGAYQPTGRKPGVDPDCVYWFRDRVPMIHPRYILSFDATSCFKTSNFAPEPYTAWLAPHHRMIYIQTAP